MSEARLLLQDPEPSGEVALHRLFTTIRQGKHNGERTTLPYRSIRCHSAPPSHPSPTEGPSRSGLQSPFRLGLGPFHVTNEATRFGKGTEDHEAHAVSAVGSNTLATPFAFAIRPSASATPGSTSRRVNIAIIGASVLASGLLLRLLLPIFMTKYGFIQDGVVGVRLHIGAICALLETLAGNIFDVGRSYLRVMVIMVILWLQTLERVLIGA